MTARTLSSRKDMMAAARSMVPADGLNRLADLRAWAEGEAEALASLCVERFDGCERHPRDETAIADRARYRRVMAICDAIDHDAVLLLRLAALLAKGE